ncbi:MAG: signal peptidase I, partial [Rikenellaceae bacterium]|nr:signal peptidase I [Rikenellaceae bacterium]
MSKIKEILHNKWFKFAIASIIYILWFVVWTGNPWLLLGELLIYDLYISKIFYKLVWSKHKRLKKGHRQYKYWMEWVEAIVFATVVATLIRIFIFEMYVIPTPSMEKSLLVGDYLCVSKVAYGPKMPNTPISFPFVHNTMPFSQTKKSYSESVTWPYHRLTGWGDVKRNDVVVFNFPAGDTVLLENQQVTYYDVVRQYQAEYGEVEGRRRLEREYTIIARPVDKRENYVKRCVGVPGDTIQVRGSVLFVNGSEQEPIHAMQYVYFV